MNVVRIFPICRSEAVALVDQSSYLDECRVSRASELCVGAERVQESRSMHMQMISCEIVRREKIEVEHESDCAQQRLWCKPGRGMEHSRR